MPINSTFDICVEENTEKAIDLRPLLDGTIEGAIQYKDEERPSSWWIMLKGLIVFFGALWGVPWIASSMQAAKIFPDGLGRSSMAVLFAIGIVLTVGGDGIWVMLTVFQLFKNRQRASKEYSLSINVCLYLMVLLCTLASCIPAVYASFVFNSGVYQFLALITLVGNFGYGLFGYQTMIYTFYSKFVEWRSKEECCKEIETRDKMLKNIHLLIESNEEFDVSDSVSFLKLTQRVIPTTEEEAQRLKMFLTIFCGLVFVVASGTVDVFLASGFFETTFGVNPGGGVILGVMCAIPGCIALYLSTMDIVDRLYSIVYHNKSFSPLLNRINPTLRVLPYCVMVVAVFAPTAAAYIVYTTLSEYGLGQGLVWFATLAVIVARFLFSNFTLNRLLEMLIVNRVTPNFGDDVWSTVQRRKYLETVQENFARLPLAAFKSE